MKFAIFPVDAIGHFMTGLLGAFVVSVLAYLTLGITQKKALFGFFYFLFTPFAAIPAFPVSLIVIVILFLLFRRVGSCMRQNLRWVAYMLLFLHWEAWGFYCSGYVTI
jgi:uncharacterized BrkB/YihY/UPF0761 family membrane protein